MKILAKDPFNLIITGVGGQGIASIALFIGKALIRKGYLVSVGDTYGIAQRGGVIVSHIRISNDTQYSPLIPQGHGDLVLGFEPLESLRALVQFGNPQIITMANIRPIYPVGVISGEDKYPDLDKLLEAIQNLSAQCRLIDASEEAARLGNPILLNMILTGIMIGSGFLPLDKESIELILKEEFPKNKLDVNMVAFTRGMELVAK